LRVRLSILTIAAMIALGSPPLLGSDTTMVLPSPAPAVHFLLLAMLGGSAWR